MQGCTPVNAHGFGRLLEFLLTGLSVVLFLFTSIILLFLFTASSKLFFMLLGLATATSSATMALLAGSTSTILALLFIALFIFRLLLLDKVLDLSALLEIVTFVSGPRS